MSLEFVLDKYPRRVTLRDGTKCVIRPLTPKDDVRFHKFLNAVPEVERLFIKEPVSRLAVVRQLCRRADPQENFVLLMLHGNQIIGEANLHQRRGGWRRHIGLVTMLTHPDYRGRDVAKILVEDIVDIARYMGLTRLESRLNGERTVAIKALEQIGFTKLLYLPDYVLDMQGRTHDYVLMGMKLRTEEEYAGQG